MDGMLDVHLIHQIITTQFNLLRDIDKRCLHPWDCIVSLCASIHQTLAFTLQYLPLDNGHHSHIPRTKHLLGSGDYARVTEARRDYSAVHCTGVAVLCELLVTNFELSQWRLDLFLFFSAIGCEYAIIFRLTCYSFEIKEQHI